MIRYVDWIATKKERKINERDVWNKIEKVLTQNGYHNDLGGIWRVFGISSYYQDIKIEIRPKDGYIFVHFKVVHYKEDEFGEDKIEENEIRIEESDVFNKEGKNLAEKWANTVLDVVNALMGKL